MTPPRILVVDDKFINVQLLKRKLEREGLHVIAAYSGREALNAVESELPDLILLDVMMPDMDGIEVCSRLQSNETTRSIPIIFITARSSKEGKIEGLAVGAVDYITKPIDLDETLARVQTQLRFVAINREMVDLQRRLVEARRTATIGAVAQGISHNLNNLLGVVIGYLDLVKSNAHKPESVIRNVTHVENAVQRIVTIIKQLSSMVGKTRLPTQPFLLGNLLSGAVRRFEQETETRGLVEIENPLKDLYIDTHIEVFESTIAALLTNGWEASARSDSQNMTITTSKKQVGNASYVEFRITDSGHGIDPDFHDQIFDPFISTKHTVGVGMGLTVARHSLRNMGGDLNLESRPNGGSVAIARHPVNQIDGGLHHG
jgi:two-component system sensor histidine kinase/response regulator